MVHKIKFIILFLISFLFCVLCLVHKNHIETNILKTLLPQDVINSSDIVEVANKSSSVIRVVFEADDQKELEELKDNFINGTDSSYFSYSKPDISPLVNLYLSNNENFLSDKTKVLLKNKKYDEIYNSALEKLYGVSALQLNYFDKDPYFLSEDFLLSAKKFQNTKEENKKYDYLQLKIKNKEGLSPDLVNHKIKELINLEKKLSNQKSKIHLAGTPVHSYYMSKSAVISINVICVLSTLLIIFLTYFYFKSFKPLIPVSISISFGMLTGFCATKLLFGNFQIITMVFCTALIGIGIDYSYHYFFTGQNGKNFKKNLSISFLTSATPFLLLFLTGIDLLKQVAVFMVFGLFGIYLVVLFIYPDFKINPCKITIKINRKLCVILVFALALLSLFGVLRFKFNDTITAFYSPLKKLKQAELLYSKISSENPENTQIITVRGKNIKNIIEHEENITSNLAEKNIEYVSLSKFIPSAKTQKENFELVKDLYKNNLDNFSEILSSNQINSLKNSKFSAVDFDINNYEFLKDFLLNDNTSLIFAFTKEKLNIENPFVQIINFKSDIENYLKKYKKILLLLFPCVVAFLYILLTFLYDFKKAFLLLVPPVLSIFISLCLTSLIMGELNLFSVITMFLVLGFTMDYSIFATDKEERTQDAILISFLTTSFSFLLLSFCNFKLLNSISLVLFFAVLSSYLIGNLLFFKKNDYDRM